MSDHAQAQVTGAPRSASGEQSARREFLVKLGIGAGVATEGDGQGALLAGGDVDWRRELDSHAIRQCAERLILRPVLKTNLRRRRAVAGLDVDVEVRLVVLRYADNEPRRRDED